MALLFSIGYVRLKQSYRSYQKKLDPMMKASKVRAYFMLILSFFTMAFFGFFAIRPTLRTIAQLNREIIDSKELDQKLTDKITALAQVQSDYELIRGAIPALNLALPQTAEFPSLVLAIEEIARISSASISGLTFDSLQIASVSAKEPNKSPKDIFFTASFTGRYEQLLQALQLLSTSKRIIRYDSVSFGKSSGTSGIITMSISIQAKSFYY